MSGYGDDPRRNASGAWDPTACAAIGRADRADAKARPERGRRHRMPTRDDVRRAGGTELWRMCREWGVAARFGERVTNDDLRERLLARLAEARKLERDERKGADMAQQRSAAQAAPDYSGALAAIAASLKEVAGKLDDLTCAVMDLKEAAPAAAQASRDAELAAAKATAAALKGYAGRLDPLFLVGVPVEAAYAKYRSWCAQADKGRPAAIGDFSAEVCSRSPLHVEGGAFAAGKAAAHDARKAVS